MLTIFVLLRGYGDVKWPLVVCFLRQYANCFLSLSYIVSFNVGLFCSLHCHYFIYDVQFSKKKNISYCVMSEKRNNRNQNFPSQIH